MEASRLARSDSAELEIGPLPSPDPRSPFCSASKSACFRPSRGWQEYTYCWGLELGPLLTHIYIICRILSPGRLISKMHIWGAGGWGLGLGAGGWGWAMS